MWLRFMIAVVKKHTGETSLQKNLELTKARKKIVSSVMVVPLTPQLMRNLQMLAHILSNLVLCVTNMATFNYLVTFISGREIKIKLSIFKRLQSHYCCNGVKRLKTLFYIQGSRIALKARIYQNHKCKRKTNY